MIMKFDKTKYPNCHSPVEIGDIFEVLVNNAGASLKKGDTVLVTSIEDNEKIWFNDRGPVYGPYLVCVDKSL
jgi:hypothetical protein